MNKLIYYLFTFILLVGPLTVKSQWMEQTSGVATSLNSVSGVNDNIAWVCNIINGITGII